VGDLSVIFPAFNEEENIRCTVETMIHVLPKVATRWEIIVVDDGSSDATAAICQKLKAEYPEVQVICHGQNRGYGAALKSGIMAANYDLIFFSDSDGQFDFRELEQLICWAEDYDIVAGYRAKRQDPLYRRINALGWNVLVRVVLGVKVRDIDCAFKLFRRSVFDHVKIRCVGAMVNTEILAQATQLGMRIREIKVTHLPRRHGKPSGANIHVILKAFRELCRVWRKLRRVEPNQPGLYSANNEEVGLYSANDQKAGLYSANNEPPVKVGLKRKASSSVIWPVAAFADDWIRWLFPRVEQAVATLVAMLALIFQDPKAPAVTASAIVATAPTAFALALEPNELPPDESRPEPAATAPRAAPLPPRARTAAASARKARTAKPRPALRIRLGKTIVHEWRQVNKARKNAQSALVRLGRKTRHTIH
jgi:glycosyltransferase involved in cell wall biosynthesis